MKIGNLTINANEVQNSANQDSGAGDQTEGGEQTGDADKRSGPWKRMDVQSDTAPVEEPQQPQAPEPQPTSEKKTYRPPSMRYQSSQPTSTPSGRLRGNKGVAPDIHNEDFFPTLSKSGENKR